MQLPTGAEKPSWGSLFAVASMIYIFVDPFQRKAPMTEWLWTGLTFAVFVVLYTLAVIYWSRRRLMARLCAAMTALAVAFTAYRPSGIVMFAYVAVLAPFAMNGRVAESATIIVAVVLLSLSEWWLLWPAAPLPYAFAAVSLLMGAAMIVVARQQIALRQTVKSVERERIARDLHDILGHTLSVVILKSELAGRLLDTDPQRAKAQIRDVERISRDALTEVRDAIRGYRSGDLSAEFDRAKSTLETAGLSVECNFEKPDLSIAQERVLALVLREAVTNVLRHSRAKSCQLSLQEFGNALRLRIHDDGRGEGNYEEGMGMRGIRERVTAMGGEASWVSRNGTELTITVPIESLASVETR